ncbi:B-box zinc finger protein 22 [Amborella trichopoda]|uniref:B box-type domain-containing protein n=1 Tax=Amborella trichopoda TaxID=13333 RepID=W1Q0N9_AMBTC|nr:B-box zinc finger protein 22 [Amborella trichopoda]ERN14144.1 hypothetical protein AMTR_s00021p00250410 [Amborella trichopoda]|eukprot:XP_006852677.1 B-box zinc finger protein 22 [Amborella trichopoda]
MKIQCNVCEIAEAAVMCCADEAALCLSCDEKVHAANKLAGKHQRVSLMNSSSQMPKCDICQETTGFFFCLEDRALLCRKCDVAIHSTSPYVSAHQRFLLTGVKVGLEPAEPISPVVPNSPSSTKKPNARRSFEISSSGVNKEQFSREIGGNGSLALNRVSFSGGQPAECLPSWPLDEILSLPDISQSYGLVYSGSPKADASNFGESNWAPSSYPADEDIGMEEYLFQVPDVKLKTPSPPTASGIHWQRGLGLRSCYDHEISNNSVFVPDISYPEQDNYPERIALKRRRQI